VYKPQCANVSYLISVVVARCNVLHMLVWMSVNAYRWFEANQIFWHSCCNAYWRAYCGFFNV